ncbi:bis-aminopropyl spermidine synthase family protein [Tissierella pigra]|uniref:Putative methyltransferase n=1 Tax=Tissierella pigra TaxID=2607614 RepID=A0A6N7XGX3_9FIRM|nr:bis-aminopropyl spermidine synthase family protein [Tissierella pigra]MBU5426837.1 bis-aminopropyl spermidine synthase family protein [Tissierella pigra]MSU01291.1 putative methyltransferase [Tissierella pigra]
MLNYIDEVNKNINIEEGKKAIENILITIYFKEGISTKELARDSLLPVPIVAAIKKEFIKKELVIQDRGTRLTIKGRHFIEEQLGFKKINIDLYMKLLIEPWKEHKEIMEIRDELQELFDNRPQADVTIDQSKSSIDTSLKRAILSLKNHNLVGKKILCLGDDDLVSIALGFLLKKLFNNIHHTTKITVMDIDKRIIDYINDISIRESLPIKCEYVDFRTPLADNFRNQFDCFFTDPPYTLEGMNLFLSRGIEALKDHSGLTIYFSYAHKSPDFQLTMQKCFFSMGLIVSEVMARFNTYEGASIIGNTGQMIVLKTTNITKSLIKTYYKGVLYTGELKETVRSYRCKQCDEIIKVGCSEKFNNIETLKSKGCYKCNSQVFELIQRKNMN